MEIYNFNIIIYYIFYGFINYIKLIYILKIIVYYIMVTCFKAKLFNLRIKIVDYWPLKLKAI